MAFCESISHAGNIAKKTMDLGHRSAPPLREHPLEARTI
jgi:hypothetical protein